jgi:hypothetical protein
MSSAPDRDEFIDYLADTSHREDETLFLPAPEGRPDSWTVFYVGILTGMAGGGIIALSPWLGGFLIFAGYGMSALSFGRPLTKFAYALRYGFALSALAGALIFAAALTFPETAGRLIDAVSKRHLTFLSLTGLPWAAAVFRYASRLSAPLKRARPRTS